MATQPGVLTDWPWHKLGNAKYILYAPFAARVVHAHLLGGSDPNNFSLHLLVLSALRYLCGQLWISLSRCQYIISKYEIQKKGITFQEVDHSSNWEDYILLNTILLSLGHAMPIFGGYSYPNWNTKGLMICLLLHMGPAECIYYWAHRALHHHYLYNRYHSHHHTLFITEANSGTSEHLFTFRNPLQKEMSIHLRNTFYTQQYLQFLFWEPGRSERPLYTLFIDCMNSVGHCNWEFVPPWVFRVFPYLKYLVYTPSYHSLHHSQVHTNFSLFMPIYDHLGGTVDKNSDNLYYAVRQGQKEKPDFVYLTHGTELLHMFHIALGIPSFSAMPYSAQWFLWPLLPLALPAMLLFWFLGQPFVADKYRLPDLRGQTWVMPRYRFQYSLSCEKNRINKMIEQAIRNAESEGARVISLGSLNKKESLNDGGSLFVTKNKDLRIRVVNGDTLTAAVVLNSLPNDVPEVFLVGSSEVCRAIAIHLCRRSVRVLMLAASRGRFESIQAELPLQNQRCLVQVSKYQAGRHCPVWILDECVEARDQKWAPPGTHFHQFATAPPLTKTRQDCTYGTYPALHLPTTIRGLRSCEVSMPRHVVHACHAGGLIHALEGWTHHEVGTIDLEQIDVVWSAAFKQGFRPV